jgi:hypothetical protein
MNPGGKDQAFGKTVWHLLFALLSATVIIQPAKAQQRSMREDPQPPFVWLFLYMPLRAPDTGTNGAIVVPSGTILPVRLNTSLSVTKSKPRQVISGRIMQDVPLPNGRKIREGSVLEGHVVEVVPGNSTIGPTISIQFDKLRSSHETIPITTSLRAVAGPMEVAGAQIPQSGVGEGDVYNWLTTTQIGGDVKYGVGGPVTTQENASQVVGSGVDGGVLSRVSAKEGTACRGAIDGNDTPQALWVVSSDACGTYGLESVHMAHAGRTDPKGVIVFASASGNLKISAGIAMLLRVAMNDSHYRGRPKSCGRLATSEAQIPATSNMRKGVLNVCDQ